MKEIIEIKKVFVPSNDGETGLPIPRFKEFMMITFQLIWIEGKEYTKYEYIPCFVKLCGNENAKRIKGDKIQMLV